MDFDSGIFDRISSMYFDWMYDTMCANRFAKTISYRKLFNHLHSIEFTYTVPKDANRYGDGVSLRYRYAFTHDCMAVLDYLDGPCSVLEMMVALAIRCEEGIMDDPSMGDRTQQWFWGMVVNLGLGGMMDERYSAREIDDAVYRFLDRDYEPNGKGGLFTVRHCEKDLRNAEIWYQMCWYLDTIT